MINDDDVGRTRMTPEQIVATFRPLLEEGVAMARTCGPDNVRAVVHRMISMCREHHGATLTEPAMTVVTTLCSLAGSLMECVGWEEEKEADDGTKV